MTNAAAAPSPSHPPTSGSPRRRSSWLRRLAYAAGALVLLLVVTWFVVTSGAFLKGVILPQVGKSLNAEVAVTDASISPFSSVVLRGLTVRTTGTEPVVSVAEVRLRYRLMDILQGTIKVDEVALVQPVIQIEQKADGTSNLDPLTRGSGEKAPAPATPPSGGSSAPPQVDITSVTISGATLRVVQFATNGGRSELKVENLNFGLTNLRNGQTAKLTLDGASEWYKSTPSNGTNALETARVVLKSLFNLGLTPALQPSQVTGEATVAVEKAGGGLADLAGLGVALNCEVTPTDLRGVTVRATKASATLAELRVSGPFQLERREGTLDVVVTNVQLADWKALAADLDPAGRFSAQARIGLEKAGQLIGFDLNAQLAGAGATVGTNRLANLGVSVQLAGRVTNQTQIRIEKASVGLNHQTRPVATLTASGSVATAPALAAAVDLGADVDLPRLVALAPAPDVAVSAGRLNAELRVSQEGKVQSAAGRVALTGLTGRLGGKDLKDFGATTRLDVGITDGRQIDLRRVLLELAGTERVRTNQIELTGRMDLSVSNAVSGALKVTSEALDVTPYYDLATASTAPAPSGSPTPAPAPAPAPGGTNAPVEPPPLTLPVGLVTLDARVGRFWLREVEATNVQAGIRVESHRVTIRPLALTMNGAPLDGDVDLDTSVTGWKYAVRFTAAGLPVEPLANSFSPEYRGRAKGDLWAKVKIDGAGVTPASLRRALAGQMSFTFTNADIQIASPRVKGFLAPVAAALNAPGLLNSPLRWAAFDLSMITGRVDLSQLALVSPVFAAATRGGLTLAEDVGTSSLGRWPMSFQLDRSLAERLKLAPKGTPTNVALVGLPDFLRVGGSVNTPKPDIDYKSLAGAALMQYADKIPGVDEKTGALLKSFGGLLTGQKGGQTGDGTNAPAVGGAGSSQGTNAVPTTNAPNPVGAVLDLFKRPKPQPQPQPKP